MADAPPISKAPAVYPETEAFWAGTAEGKLLLKVCKDCGEAHFYPRQLCPHCFSDKTEWVESAGRGFIYTYTQTDRAPIFRFPAMVALDEGPVLMTAIIDCEAHDIEIGKRVTLTFAPTEGEQQLPVFRID
tara:strand:+ start:23840 stop:24232 length:393 start_codon:yes stop_codon:yes gene_type:complete